MKVLTFGVLLACNYAQRFPRVVRERCFNRDRPQLNIDRKTTSSVIFGPCTFSFTVSCAWGGFIARACVTRCLKTDGVDGCDGKGQGGGRRAVRWERREKGGRFGGERVEERADTCCSTGAHIACANFVRWASGYRYIQTRRANKRGTRRGKYATPMGPTTCEREKVGRYVKTNRKFPGEKYRRYACCAKSIRTRVKNTC